ncbi:MAG: GGDEF domain-containing protein [Thermoleophilia bacterium]|nr:GGDEF domain-containing protein [Thermoleophilia bacterium]
MLARVTPFVAGQLTGDVVALAPVDELTQGSGSVVTSTRLAVLAGLLAGLLVLPLVFRATRPVAAMHRKATIDPLTGLVNRAELARRGARVLRRARGGGGLAAVAVLDLDGFKEINDRHGHQTGDEVLRAFAGRLRAAVRSGDVVARLGGDEFVVVLAGRAGRVTGEVFDRLLDDCQARPVSTSSGGHVVLCTVGYADDTAGDGDLDELIARADAALIAGKANRKGRVYRAGPAGVAVASAA